MVFAVGTAIPMLVVPCLGLTAGESKGIWTSVQELRANRMQGPAWEAVTRAAYEQPLRASVANQSDCSNTRVLAAAIVFARTGDVSLKARVTRVLDQLVADGHPSGTTLAWSRKVGAYVLAADLVGYRKPSFKGWLRNLAHQWKAKDGRTILQTFHTRPNNWGTHAFGTLAAIYSYLNDEPNLSAIRAYWVRGVTISNPDYKFGKDRSWHLNEFRPLQINPQGASKNGISIDGLFPDEMRRGGPCRLPPVYTNYAWEAQQGLVMAARILERAEMPIWDVADRALLRAAYALQVRLGGPWRAKGDDLWMLAFYDAAYGTTWSRGKNVWGAGKNVGWSYVLNHEALASDVELCQGENAP